jgi:hypothetical protein
MVETTVATTGTSWPGGAWLHARGAWQAAQVAARAIAEQKPLALRIMKSGYTLDFSGKTGCLGLFFSGA